MDDRENVIKEFEAGIQDFSPADTSDERFKEVCEAALAMLKAQEPVKPLVTGNGHTFAEAETWWYECGNCNDPIDPNDQYCRHCGRAVKWDD